MDKEKELYLKKIKNRLVHYPENKLTFEQQNYIILLVSEMVDLKRQGQNDEKLMKFADNQIMLWDNQKQIKKALMFVLEKPKGVLGILGDFFIGLGTIYNVTEQQKTK